MKGKEVNNGTRFPARIDFCLSCLGDERDPDRCESWNLYIGPAVQVRIGQLASTISFSCAGYVQGVDDKLGQTLGTHSKQ